MAQHKWAEVIKAWADGKTIQYKVIDRPDWKDWVDHQGTPLFGGEFCVWRVKPEPLEWQVERDAHADGKAIEWRNTRGWGVTRWKPITSPSWMPAAEGFEYRVKPEEVVRYLFAAPEYVSPLQHDVANFDNLKLTFIDGKLVKSEVL